MAHQSRFLSVNLNNSYGKSSTSSTSSASAYGNVRTRSAGGGGGMVVLSRPRSSSGAAAQKPTSRLAVPPPVNLPSLRKEHERLDPASSRPSAGHGGSGIGHGHGSSMSWTKPAPPVPEFRDKDEVARSLSTGEQRSYSGISHPQRFMERAVILKGEDFPSLLATANHSSNPKQKPVSENSDAWAEKAEHTFAIDMRPQLKSSSLSKSNVQGSEGGVNQVRNSKEQEDGKFQAPLLQVRLRHTSDWDDDERPRNRSFSGIDQYDGRASMNGSFSRDSSRGDPHLKESIASKKEDSNASSWRVTVQPNRELPTSRLLPVGRDHSGPRNSSVQRGTVKESNHDRLSYGDRREFGFGMGTRNVGVSEPSIDRVEVSSNWQRGKVFANGMISKGPLSPRIKSFSMNDHVQSSNNEKLSNIGKPFAENASWCGKDAFSIDATLDLNAKVYRKKKEVVKHADLFDPVRESFEAELEMVQRLQEQERQRVMEEQARALEFARKETEERERIAREEEERRRLLEEEAREALWRAEQEKMEAARRAEEQRVAREEERRKILIEEERRKEAARQKLLELEARIARRQTEAAINDRMKERNPLRDSDLAEWEKTETTVEHSTSSPSFDSFSTKRLSEVEFKHHTSSVENYSSAHRGQPENNWSNNNQVAKFQDQESVYPSERQDTFQNRSFHRKQFQSTHGPNTVTTSFKRGMPDGQTHTGKSWDRNGDCDPVRRSNVDPMFGGWDHEHFDGNQLHSFSERSFRNNEMDDLNSFSRVRHTVRQPRVPPPPPLSTSMRRSPFRAVGLESSKSSLPGETDARINPDIRNGDSDIQTLYGSSYHQRDLEPGTPELLEECASSLLQTEEKCSPRYDSQSSLSVSNPPTSPTQLSHDDFDDCEGPPALSASVEEENIIFSEVKPVIPELGAGKISPEMIAFSPGEDDEWAIEDNEEVFDEDDHNEGLDINQEEIKGSDSDYGVLEMEHKLEDFNGVVEKPQEICDTPHDIDVCIQIGASGGKKSTEQGLVNDSISDPVFANNSAGSLQSEEITNKIMTVSPEIAETTVESQEDQLFCPVTNVDLSTDCVRVSNCTGQNPIAAVSRFPLPSTSSFCSPSEIAASSSCQNDVPAKLQFGLFSSPPLIPSPIPTIQIGSIQMPLPLNAQIDAYTQMHHSHSPLFQFGQLRYTPPVVAQTMSFVHPPIARHPVDRKRSSLTNQVSQDSITEKVLNKGHPSPSSDKQPICALEVTNSTLDHDQSITLFNAPRDEVPLSHRPTAAAASVEKKSLCKFVSNSDYHETSSDKNYRPIVHSRRARGRPHTIDSYSSVRKYFSGQSASGTMSEIKGNRLTYNVRNSNPPPSLLWTESLYENSNRPQRGARRHIHGTEYRIKEIDGARKMQDTDSFYYKSNHLKSSLVGASTRNMGRKGLITTKSRKLVTEETAPSGVHNNMTIDNKKETAPGNFRSVGNLSNSALLEEDIDAPLQSGIVRVYNQPVEASSDGDGFVEVRSKRKISNERRGLRERESSSKHKVMKLPRKHHANHGIAYKAEMATTLVGGSSAISAHTDLSIAHRRPNLEESKLPITSMEGQTIPSLGSPALNCTDNDTKSNSLKSSPRDPELAIANNGVKVAPSLSFGNDIVSLDKASVPLGNWGVVHFNQTAFTSAQSQIDEPSNSEEFTNVYQDDNCKLAISTVTKEKLSFSSEKLPNFPFDGEKIQFGAVASPSLLPAPSGIWPSSSVMMNASIIHNLPMTSNCQSNFFDKEKFHGENCTHLDDTEAEAEAAASAVAVAAITNDEITVSKSVTASISSIGIKTLTGQGMTRCTDVTGQSASEESLVVTLPADLSVDTPLSLWPPLSNLPSSRPLSHIAGPHPSPFPFFDPSPMIGGPIFAFRSQDESNGSQAQQQQSATFVSGSTGTWPQCHSGVDSFYGSPAGYPAPFISPPAGLSGVHGHPPMVFYNHFAPVGQFGQVGLSYMGNNYLPTGKKPEWNHSTEGNTSMNMNKADSNNLNVVYGQQNVTHIPTSIQHLSTGSAVMQVTSPFTMFNLRPFQSSTEAPIPTQFPPQWPPPLPHPPPHSVRLSTPSEQRQNMPLDPSGAKLSSPQHRSAAADLPDELGLVESASGFDSSNAHAIRNHATANINKDSNGIPSPATRVSEAPKPRDFERTSSPIQQHLGPIGKSGPSLNTASGGEWGRRNSFQGKHRYGSNKNVGPTKTKQIYVPKSLLTGPATPS